MRNTVKMGIFMSGAGSKHCLDGKMALLIIDKPAIGRGIVD